MRLFRQDSDRLTELTEHPLETGELERDVETYIVQCPEFLGERLLLIGRQIAFPELSNEKIDLLALDAEARLVVIELKKGQTPSDVDFQALKYVSYVADKSPEELMELARGFYGLDENLDLKTPFEESGVDPSADETTLEDLLAASFGNEAAYYTEKLEHIAEAGAQRIIVAAESFDPRIALIISWLHAQGVQIRGIRYQRYSIGDETVFISSQFVPTHAVEDDLRGRTSFRPRADEEWKIDGQEYHRRQLPLETWIALNELLKNLGDAVRLLQWGQKYYVWIIGSNGRRLLWQSYIKSRFDLGFDGLTEEECKELVGRYGLDKSRVKVKPGYERYPFYLFEVDEVAAEAPLKLLREWLADPSETG